MKYLLGAGEDPDDLQIVCATHVVDDDSGFGPEKLPGPPLLFDSVHDAGLAARTLIEDQDDDTHSGTTFFVLKAVPVAAYMPAAGGVEEVRHGPDSENPEPDTEAN